MTNGKRLSSTRISFPGCFEYPRIIHRAVDGQVGIVSRYMCQLPSVDNVCHRRPRLSARARLILLERVNLYLNETVEASE